MGRGADAPIDKPGVHRIAHPAGGLRGRRLLLRPKRLAEELRAKRTQQIEAATGEEARSPSRRYLTKLCLSLPSYGPESPW